MAFLKPDPPQPPDPQQTAAAQTGSNIATALANARLNRVNQTTPWGSINYTQGPVDEHGVPTYSSRIELSPAQQQLLEQQQGMQRDRGHIASNLLGQVGDRMGQPLDLSHLHQVYDRYAPQGGGQPPGGGGPLPPPPPPGGAPMVGNPAARGPAGTGIPGIVPGQPGASVPTGGQPPVPIPTGGGGTNPLLANPKLAMLVQMLRGGGGQ